MPALHTSTSSGLCKASTAAQKAAAPSAEPMSPAVPCRYALGWPACVLLSTHSVSAKPEKHATLLLESGPTWISATTALVVAYDLPLIMTRAPAFTSLMAIALPMPEVLPVTTASFPWPFRRKCPYVMASTVKCILKCANQTLCRRFVHAENLKGICKEPLQPIPWQGLRASEAGSFKRESRPSRGGRIQWLIARWLCRTSTHNPNVQSGLRTLQVDHKSAPLKLVPSCISALAGDSDTLGLHITRLPGKAAAQRRSAMSIERSYQGASGDGPSS